MEGELIKVNKFKSVEDWNTWKFQVKILMIANEYFGVANASIEKPELLNIQTDAVTRAAYEKELKQWVKLDGVAQKIIVLHVSQGNLLPSPIRISTKLCEII